MMRGAWVKSLHCKSNAVDDVVYPAPPPPPPPPSSSSSRKQLFSTAYCSNSSSAVKDAVFVFPKCPSSSSSLPKKPTRLRENPKPSSYLSPSSSQVVGRAVERAARGTVGFPTLSEFPAGHSSRRVVELIFLSSWSSSASVSAAAFPGEIEMLFRVHNPARTLARFEDRRAAARARPADDARCAADGNEMMRFHYGAPGRCGNVYDAGVSWSARGKLKGVRTFSGSGGAHACGGGGSSGSAGRSAMLVCRVIAGRVRCEYSSEADSVSLGNDELVVLDPWAVLPCFLIIYKI